MCPSGLYFSVLVLGDSQRSHGTLRPVSRQGDEQRRFYSQYRLGVVALLPSKGDVSTVSRSGRLVTPQSLYKDVTGSGYTASLINSGRLRRLHGFSGARLSVSGGEDKDQCVRLELGLESQ